MNLFSKLLTHRVVGISSGGGHLSELQLAMPLSLKNEAIYITSKNCHTMRTLEAYKCYFIVDPHSSIIKYIINAIQAFLLFMVIKPKIIISTGAGIAIPFMIIGKVFGSRLIFIETGARVYTTSKTGKFMYKYADKYFVQYKELLKHYPSATLGSLH